MTRNEAINYLRSSGMTDEQIKTVADAFSCDEKLHKIKELIKEFDDNHTPYAINMVQFNDLTINQIIEYMTDMDDLIEDITYNLLEVEE